MHNLGTVISFEFVRTVHKKVFWVAALAFPCIIAIVFGLSYFSGKSADTAGTEAASEHFSLEVIDQSGLIRPDALSALGATAATGRDQGIADVRDGRVDAFFFYPQHPATQPVEVYGKDVGLTKDGRYSSVAESLLSASVTKSVGSSEAVAIIQGASTTQVTTYADGKEAPGIERVFAPGIFLVILYLLVVLMGNRMLTSTTEEKENRVIEMILTSVDATTLIVGKVISLFGLGLIQIAVTLLPIVIAFAFFRDKLHLPSIDFAHLPVDPMHMLIGFLVLVCGYLLFTGILVAIGAAVPTAKEANGFFGVAVACMFVPLYAIAAIVSNPDQIIVKVFTFFPLSAPVTLLLRNAVGNLSPAEAWIGISILVVSSVAALSIAIHAFRTGTLEYGRKLSLRELFGR